MLRSLHHHDKDQLLGRLNSADGGNTCSPTFASLCPTGYPPPVTYAKQRYDYRLSLDYKFNDQLMVYATHSTGFKAGGVSPRFSSTVTAGPVLSPSSRRQMA